MEISDELSSSDEKTPEKLPTEQEKFRSFVLFLGGQFVSLFGSSIVMFAIIWWITVETGSALFLSFASFLSFVPIIVLIPFAGVYADRWNKKHMIIISDLLQAVFTLGLIILFAIDMANIVAVLLLILLRGICQAFHQPALMSIIPFMVPPKYLAKVNSVSTFLSGMLLIITPVVAASLMVFFSVGQVFWVDIITFVIAVIPSIFLKLQVKKRKKKSKFKKEFKEGIEALKQIEGLLTLLMLFSVVSFFIAPFFILSAYFVNITHSGSEFDLALVQALFQGGVVIGAIIVFAKKNWNKKVLTIFIMSYMLLVGMLIILFSPIGAFLIIGIGRLIMGIGMAILNTMVTTLIQSIVAPRKQGRVMSIVMVITNSVIPLSMIISGFFVEILGIYLFFWLCVIGSVVVITIGVFNTNILSIDKFAKEKIEKLNASKVNTEESAEKN